MDRRLVESKLIRDYPIQPDQVGWLYRCLLGREVESEQMISSYVESGLTFEQCRLAIRESDEFKSGLSRSEGYQYFIPDRSRASYTKSHKKVSLATIVKNEQDIIANMLYSCAPLLDFVTILDTGSTDNTVDIIRNVLNHLQLPFYLGSVPFEDFSQARNAVLEKIPKDIEWILMLDADEEIISSDYPKFNTLIHTENVDGWQLPRFLFSDAAKRKPVISYPDYQARLFRNRPNDPVRFAGRVHERPSNVLCRDAPMCRCEHGEVGGPHIHHLGYIEITPEQWQKKHDFYKSLSDMPST